MTVFFDNFENAIRDHTGSCYHLITRGDKFECVILQPFGTQDERSFFAGSLGIEITHYHVRRRSGHAVIRGRILQSCRDRYGGSSS